MAVGRKQERYKNRVGRILTEILYGNKFDDAKGLTRVINLSSFSKHLQYSQPDIVEYLRFMEGSGLLEDLRIDYKTIYLTIAPPVGIKRKTNETAQTA